MPSRRRFRYWFEHHGTEVCFTAGSPGFAKQMFRNRYGYLPADPTKKELVQ